MAWLHSRRLRYCLGGTAILFVLFVALRALFFLGFSGFDSASLGMPTVLQTLGIGLRFDLRLAILMMLPMVVLAWLPRWNLVGSCTARLFGRGYLALALVLTVLIYIVDFGH